MVLGLAEWEEIGGAASDRDRNSDSDKLQPKEEMDHLTLQEKGSAGQVWPARGMNQIFNKGTGFLFPRPPQRGLLAQVYLHFCPL